MHYYPHHIGDYRRDTASLSLTEHGVYRALMDEYYVREESLPDDLAALCRICRAMTKTERDAVRSVMSRLFKPVDNKLTHKRIEFEIEAYRINAEKNRQNGKKGGRPPKQKPSGLDLGNPVGNPNDNPNESQPRTSTQEPSTIERNAGAWPDLDEVKKYAPTVMAPEECAEHFWNGCEAAGWVTRHGQPIADWRPLFRNFATSWKANDYRAKTTRLGPPKPIKPTDESDVNPNNIKSL